MCEIWQEQRGEKKKELTTGKFLPKFVISEHRTSKPEVGEWVWFYKKPIACGEKKKKKTAIKENLAVDWIWQIILAGENS